MSRCRRAFHPRRILPPGTSGSMVHGLRRCAAEPRIAPGSPPRAGVAIGHDRVAFLTGAAPTHCMMCSSLETIQFIAANLPVIWQRALEHIMLVGVAVSVAIVTGVTTGILITQSKAAADRVLYVAAVVMTIPSIALFGLLIPILSLIGQGIGYLPAVIALILYSQLPIIRNTYTAIMNVDPALREAARGMGMTTLQRLRDVELPIALPVIINGVRNAVVLNIAIAAIATYIGAGGLGTFISRGISQTDVRQLLTGALSVSLLAIVADFTLLGIQRAVTPAALRGP